ncbi:MAG: GAF and ANTAR domain-containing protein [Aeromicrobium sp.]
MKPAQAARALAEATSSITTRQDVVDALVDLLDKCRVGLDVNAGGILVETSHGLDLLVSTSHAITELELHQLHIDEGPCVDAHRTGERVQEHTRSALLERWPRFGQTMVTAGYESVHASPLGYDGLTFGAMGLFRRDAEPFTDDESVIAQAFADIGSMLIIPVRDAPAEEVPTHLDEALSARIMIEQAKGVLAEHHDLPMPDAYELLVRSARDRRLPLTTWAATVLSSAEAPRG